MSSAACRKRQPAISSERVQWPFFAWEAEGAGWLSRGRPKPASGSVPVPPPWASCTVSSRSPVGESELVVCALTEIREFDNLEHQRAAWVDAGQTSPLVRWRRQLRGLEVP